MKIKSRLMFSFHRLLFSIERVCAPKTISQSIWCHENNAIFIRHNSAMRSNCYRFHCVKMRDMLWLGREEEKILCHCVHPCTEMSSYIVSGFGKNYNYLILPYHHDEKMGDTLIEFYASARWFARFQWLGLSVFLSLSLSYFLSND